MISYLKGTIRFVYEEALVLEVAGVGYELMIPAGLGRWAVDQLGQEAEFHVYSFIQGMNVGAGRMVLIGFKDYADRQFFEKLIQVSGVGPRAAVRAMVRPSRELARAIEQADVAAIKALPGFGKRTAEKIIAQLNGKLYDVLLSRSDSGISAAAPESELVSDVKAVLGQLGYDGREVDELITPVLEENPKLDDVQAVIREIYRKQSEASPLV